MTRPHPPTAPPPGTDPAAPLTVERFRVILDAYGACSERWPEQERAAALTLLDRSAEARALRDEAANLDAALDLAPVEPPSPALLAAVLDAAPPRPASQFRQVPPLRRRIAAALAGLWPAGPVWQPATALATALVLGLVVGIAAPPGGTTTWPAEGDLTVDRLAFGLIDYEEEGTP